MKLQGYIYIVYVMIKILFTKDDMKLYTNEIYTTVWQFFY